jgi:phage terminase large subunit-like protein
MTTTVPDFNTLSEAEKRAVAERLLRIEESGWKPFWCPDPDCEGMPHWVEVPDDDDPTQLVNIFVSETDTVGPIGQPLGPVVYETDDGELVWDDDQTNWDKTLPVVGRPVLDPNWAHNHARADQRLPPWNTKWTLFIMSGRGSGKTRTGVEFVTLCARKGLDGAILGRRGTELVNTHVAEIIANAHPEFVPVHWASKDILEWPNGAITYLFSAEKPENIRSVNLSYAWVDEAAFMDEIETAWMNLRLATRVKKPGNPIHFLITSTPTGTPWVMKMEDDPDVEVRRVSTYANRANLDPDFLADLEKEYEGTRMGRQELHGEVLRDVEGALWNDDMFKHLRLDATEFHEFVEGLDDRVLAVDPAGSKGKRSDATGIIGVGAHHFGDDGSPLARSNLYVLGRATIKGTPAEWAEQVFKAARLLRVSRIVAEKNFGGDMVKQVLSDWAALNPTKAKDENGEDFRIEVVHAVKSKETRAEGVVGKYEQGTVTHVTSPTAFGDLSELEKQQVTWVPKSRGGRMPSPNDIDALVWAVRALETKVKFAGQVATQANVFAKLKAPAAASQRAGAPTLAGRTGGPTHLSVINSGPAGPRGRKAISYPLGVKKRPVKTP